MAINGVGLPSSVVHGPEVSVTKYPYRTGTGMMPSAEWYVFHDDFTGSVTTNVPVGWTATIIDTGATVVVDATLANGNGVLYFDSDGATEGATIYGTLTQRLIVGKRWWMEMRFKTEVADDSDVQFGLSALTAVTNPEDVWTTTAADVVAFGVLDGSAVLTMLVDTGNGGTAAITGTRSLTSATWHTLAISYDGAGGIRGYLDGKLACTWTGAAATIPTSIALAPFVGWRNGSAATTEGQLDYVRIVSER